MNVLFRNPLGITIERTDYKRRSAVKVHNNGYNLRTYRFNNVAEFESPYISWANLDQCGGWATSDAYLNTAVQRSHKLFAQIVHFDHREFETSDEVVITTGENHLTGRGYLTHISRKGSLADYYDLAAVREHYSRLGVVLTDNEWIDILVHCCVELTEFGTVDAPFDYVNASTAVELIVTGLLLGYPLESTASIIEEWCL